MASLPQIEREGLGGSASAPGREGTALASVLPRLAQETELQKMLADEKMRAEQHKTNYQTLKVKHTALFDEYVVLEKEMKSTIEESRLVQEKYHALLDQARRELAAKHAECEQLRKQGPTDQQVELLRLKMGEELEVGWRERLVIANSDSESCRQQYNKLKYEHSFLQAEYQHERQEHQRTMEETLLRHKTEVENLRKEREAMLAKQNEGGSDVSQRLRGLQRENAQLQLRMKSLVGEVEELQAQREHAGVQAENMQRLQAKQLAEHAATVKALETERESLKLQVESTQRELSAAIQSQSQLTGRIHDLEKDNVVLKGRVDEATHKSKVELTNLRMEMLKERGELERDRDRLLNTIKELESQVETTKAQIEHQAEALVSKEEDAERQIQAAREQEWHKFTQLETEKLELETKLQGLERAKIDEEAHKAAEAEKRNEKLRAANDAREVAEKEALVVKTKLQQQQSLLAQLEQTRAENASLAARLHRVETQYNSYVSSETELIDLNAELKTQVDKLTHELDRSKETASRSCSRAEEALASTRTSAANDRLNLQARVDELEGQVTDCHKKINEMADLHKRKKQAASRLVSRLKQKMALQQAQLEQIHLEKEALKKSIPQETHLHVKKRLNDLLRRHRDFHTVMVAANFDANKVGNLSMSGSLPPMAATTNPLWSTLDMNQKDVASLKDRMNTLSHQQQKQLAELRGVSPDNTHLSLHLSDDDEEYDDDDDLFGAPGISPRGEDSNASTPRDDDELHTEDLNSHKE